MSYRGRCAASKVLVAILRQEPHRDDALLERGMICLKAGRTGEALTHLAKAAWVNPAHIAIRYQYGVALANASRRAEAAVQFKAALMIRPDDAEIRAALNDALLRSQNGREEDHKKG
ncbi:MAG TPA: tetratricopeptide repeat protein [Syntrophales bacterium]|nr:tetratricopeptide repeat protein [Syntrophales bacterium]